jgi:hypothetical protein
MRDDEKERKFSKLLKIGANFISQEKAMELVKNNQT